MTDKCETRESLQEQRNRTCVCVEGGVLCEKRLILALETRADVTAEVTLRIE